MPEIRRRPLHRPGLVGLALLALACGPAAPVTPPPPPPLELPTNLAHPPVTTFAARCARCHGAGGSRFPRPLTRTTEPELLLVTYQMMRGAARLHPSDADVYAMAAYLRSMEHQSPFAVIVNGAEASGGNDPIRGEAADGTAIALIAGGRKFEIALQDATWSIADPPTSFTLQCRSSGGLASFTFPGAQWPASPPPAAGPSP